MNMTLPDGMSTNFVFSKFIEEYLIGKLIVSGDGNINKIKNIFSWFIYRTPHNSTYSPCYYRAEVYDIGLEDCSKQDIIISNLLYNQYELVQGKIIGDDLYFHDFAWYQNRTSLTYYIDNSPIPIVIPNEVFRADDISYLKRIMIDRDFDFLLDIYAKLGCNGT